MGDSVYFLRNPATGLIKIGFSGGMQRRLWTLRREFPGAELLAHAPGNRHTEDALHAAFYADHVAGEWFRASPRLNAAIIAINEGWFHPATLPSAVSPLRKNAARRGHLTRLQRRGDHRPIAAVRAAQPADFFPEIAADRDAAA